MKQCSNGKRCVKQISAARSQRYQVLLQKLCIVLPAAAAIFSRSSHSSSYVVCCFFLLLYFFFFHFILSWLVVNCTGYMYQRMHTDATVYLWIYSYSIHTMCAFCHHHHPSELCIYIYTICCMFIRPVRMFY